MLKILLNAGTSPNLGYAYGIFLMLTTIISVKIALTRRQSAGVRSLHTSVASQRLHAEDLSSNSKNYIFKSLKNKCLLSKGINLNVMSKMFYSYLSTPSNNSKNTLPPYYVTGISDGESSFHVSILKNKNYRSGFQIQAKYTIQLHSKDLELLTKLQSFFGGVGSIIIKKEAKSAIFSIQSLKDISNVIIPHFDKYPLLTKKRADYFLFKMVVNLMVKGSHLSPQGIDNILSIKASMNKGLSPELCQLYPHIKPVKRPAFECHSMTVNWEWLCGFIEAEGSFFCLIRPNLTHLIKYQVTLSFVLTQDTRDLDLMLRIKEYLGFGIVSSAATRSITQLTVTKRGDLDILISLFQEKGGLFGCKSLDLKDFIKIQEIVKSNAHKTEEGLQDIKLIKRNMNLRRIHE